MTLAAAKFDSATRCHCGKPVEFGYRNERGTMDWFCAEHRRGQRYADARIGNVPNMAADSDRPPDLQALVAAYNGYHKITPEAWAAFDHAMIRWQINRRDKFGRC
jgi:hypothetical protein